MHILLIPSWYPDHPGDVKGVFFRDQALALKEFGHQIGVIAPNLRSLRSLLGRGEIDKPSDFELDEGIATYREEVLSLLPRVPYGSFWLLKRAAKNMFRNYIKRHGKPDIIHAHSSIFAGIIATDLASEHGIPIVLTEHSSGFARGTFKNWQLKLAERASVKADLVISVSPSLGRLLGNLFPLTRKRWQWIPNVVADRFNSPKRIPKNNDAIIFLNLAFMNENKGQRDLLRAFQKVATKYDKAELWLAGDGPTRSDLEKEVINLGLYNRVRFLGVVTPELVPELFKKVDVMVVSSHYETFGVVIAEALMAGLPAIATRCGGPESIIQKYDGLLVPVRDPGALGDAMCELLENLKFFDSEAIAERAFARFSGKAIASRLTNEYEKLITRNSQKTDCA